MKNASNKYIGFVTLLCAVLLAVQGCQSSGDGRPAPSVRKEKVYKGELLVMCDAGLEPIVKQQVEVFEFIYDSVKIDIQYRNEESSILNDFGKQKKGVVIISRNIDKAERDRLKEHDSLYVRDMPVAHDAVAIIGNKNFDDSNLSLDKLKSYFDPSNKSSTMRMVFENQNSSTVSYVLGKLGYKNKVSNSVYALKSVDEVADYVEGNTEAIGFIPYSFISDTDDDRVKALLKRIKILSLQTVNAKGEQVRVSANQSDIADGTYPLIRTLNALCKFNYDDSLEWLFMNFLYKEKGARIFLKAGLIPVKAPEREINVNTGDMNTGN